MLLDFSIKNFGPIKDEQILSFEALPSTRYEEYYIIHPMLANGKLILRQNAPIRLLKLAVIYGANASGKTTILETLDFFRQLALNERRDKSQKLDFLPFAFNTTSPKEPTQLKIRFFQKGILFEHQFEINRHCIIKEIVHYWDYNTSGRKRLLFKRDTHPHDQVTELTKISNLVIAENDLTQQAIESLQLATLWNESILVGFNKVNFIFKELQLMREWYSDVLEPMINSHNSVDKRLLMIAEEDHEAKTFMTEFLQQSDFNIEGFQVEKRPFPKLSEELELVLSHFQSLFAKVKNEDHSENNNLLEKIKDQPIKTIQVEYLVEGKHYLLPFEYTSLGTKRTFILAGLLYLLMKQNKVLMIDEFESSLHPDLAEFFLLTFLKSVQHSQLILTTHSRDLMKINELVDRRDIIWFTAKNDLLETELYSLGDFSTREIRPEASIYNLYKIGKLGATPNI
ncbi:hypothetical protein DC083_01135 [Ignatzschineria ureiclastica]|uniref:ATPase AAA-type core domain-containing protein n=1 Tax=Ignatzschineria ureiclastica TaxID=472582 RepID=A0A2U2AGS6_9GAMM|nr:ATP-binding protein [Ignatzschineria ureiclastica]PWD81827.1 hypothetical protein DC083_01135 [Ignatzschineria ureiclastica]GGZ90772.1 transporter [Ignatzschineria ureiclastica]